MARNPDGDSALPYLLGALDLVLDESRENRSQIVFSRIHGA